MVIAKFAKSILRTVLKSKAISRVADATVVPAAAFAIFDSLHTTYKTEKIVLSTEQLARQLSPELKVLRGPFAGLVYPGANSIGSTFLPKIVGTYEFELQFIIEAICCSTYESIVDVGCAEGYYAVGLAKRIASASVVAVDIDAKALALCGTMAQCNGVVDRVQRITSVPLDWIEKYIHGRRSLVICDCEGHELELLSNETVDGLAGADLIVETHDFLRQGATATIAKRFEKTHHVMEIRSIHDRIRATAIALPELLDLDPETRFRIVQEGRPRTMSWLVLRSRQCGSFGNQE